MSGHTSGPWHVGGKDGCIVYAADGWAIANAVVHHGKHEGDAPHNARLLAMAPTMLALLRDVVALLPVAGRLHPDDLHSLQSRALQVISDAS